MCCKFMPLVEIRRREGSPFASLNGAYIHKDYTTPPRTEMLEHLKKHKDSGDYVPSRAFDRLEEDL